MTWDHLVVEDSSYRYVSHTLPQEKHRIGMIILTVLSCLQSFVKNVTCEIALAWKMDVVS